MSLSMQASTGYGVAHRIARWWQEWTNRRRTMAQLDYCGAAEVERMAHDVGVSASELHTLAGKWPDAAEPLKRRLAALALDADDIRYGEPQTLHDLQRVCTLCMNRRECEHDLAANPARLTWRSYCPNVMTLDALRAGRRQAN